MPGEVQVGYWETFPLRKSSAAVAQLPMEVVGSPSMEGVPELRRRGTEGRGQWAWWGGLGLGLGILEVFSYLGDSMVLGVDTGITGLGHSGCVFACG